MPTVSPSSLPTNSCSTGPLASTSSAIPQDFRLCFTLDVWLFNSSTPRLWITHNHGGLPARLSIRRACKSRRGFTIARGRVGEAVLEINAAEGDFDLLCIASRRKSVEVLGAASDDGHELKAGSRAPRRCKGRSTTNHHILLLLLIRSLHSLLPSSLQSSASHIHCLLLPRAPLLLIPLNPATDRCRSSS